MDVYGGINPPSADTLNFRIDDLLDFSNDDLFSSTTSSSTASTSDHLPSLHHSAPTASFHHHSSFFNPAAADFSPDYFAHQLSLPKDDVAELEWLSQFVDDSFADFPPNSVSTATTINNVQSSAAAASFSSSASRAARSKRSRHPMNAAAWISQSSNKEGGGRSSRASSPTAEGGVRVCTHCASEKTPQWRTGPMGPKTLCNACGVRYKSGRLVPEYRPAASPTFVLTQHSNSHRKVVELRRQKEMMYRQQAAAPGESRQMSMQYNQVKQDFNVY
ncbi:GATA transcription factor 2 [Linum perenne]